ncbi:MAG: hypothetical protein ACOXZQ_01960 [Bacteroidales bacterium]|jgi:hypothetical protein|nr:hypothetical protein [Bacteroidales bacterium]HNV66245.1 hypothetical protein [Bacteroidales bacterium]HPV26933.1 hypothetical protein [Bacteroidales bacterium]
MFKSLLYKEWIKIRLVFWLALGISLLALINIFLKVRHDILFVDAANYWYSFLFRNQIYFSILKFLPFVIGLAVAIAQYIPETVNKRIKLTFHLPVSENGVLIRMHAFGALILLALFLVILGLFTAGSAIFFPSNIIRASLITMLPWFLGGMATYFLVALILLEPMWIFRGLYTAVATGFVAIFFTGASIGAFGPVLLPLTLITLLLSCVVLFSGYRFRKGEM